MININSWFSFKGLNSRDFDILVEKQPDIVRPERHASEYTVPGRSGTLYHDEKTFSNMTKTVECGLLSSTYLDEISAWLTGGGEVVFSSEGTKVYDAFIKNSITFKRVWGKRFKKFIVLFDCLPFKRGIDAEQDNFTMTAPGRAHGKGTWTAEPVLTVYGTGNITLDINGCVVSLSDVSGFAVIDSKAMDCYKGTENLNPKMTGEFPVLVPEENSFSWSGNVERVEVSPGWRWI